MYRPETCIGYPKRKIPDPIQTRNRVGFGFENQFFYILTTQNDPFSTRRAGCGTNVAGSALLVVNKFVTNSVSKFEILKAKSKFYIYKSRLRSGYAQKS